MRGGTHRARGGAADAAGRRSSSPAASACTTCARARARRWSTSTAPRARSTTSRSRSGRGSAERYDGRGHGPAGLRASAARPAGGRELGPRRRRRCCAPPPPSSGSSGPLLVGHSLGAAVALAWALDAPDDVAAVVTLGGYVLPLGGPPPWVVALAALPAPSLRGVGALGRSRLGRPLVRERRASGRSPPARPPAGRTCAIAPRLALAAANARSATARTARSPRTGLAALRAALPGPRGAARDRRRRRRTAWCRRRSPSGCTRWCPGSELVRVPGAGHMPQFTAPDAVMAAVDRARRSWPARGRRSRPRRLLLPRRAGSLDAGRARRGASGALYPQSATAGLNPRPRGRSARLSAVSRR